jgi:hypothetical protein
MTETANGQRFFGSGDCSVRVIVWRGQKPHPRADSVIPIKTGSRHPREDQWRLNLTSGSTISSEIRLEADFGVGPGGTVAATKEWRRTEDDFFL